MNINLVFLRHNILYKIASWCPHEDEGWKELFKSRVKDDNKEEDSFEFMINHNNNSNYALLYSHKSSLHYNDYFYT